TYSKTPVRGDASSYAYPDLVYQTHELTFPNGKTLAVATEGDLHDAVLEMLSSREDRIWNPARKSK
ncbi:MAG: hypothetical protein RLZZ182_1500, partial [Pseudomonadota bacterium]